MMLFIRSLIFNVLVFVWMLVMGIVCFPISVLYKEGAQWSMKAYSKHVIWMMRVILGIDFEVRGTVPTEGNLVVSKHQSFVDMILLQDTLPRAKFVMKSELRWAPILGWYAMRAKTVAVKRGKGAAAIAAMTKAVAEQADRPGQITIFPQGTRVQPGVDAPYKIGSWRLYDTFNLTCVPAALNTGLFWGKRSFLRPPGTMILEFLDPIEPGMEAKPFIEAVERIIEPACEALYAEAAAKGEGIKWQSQGA